MLTRIGQYVSLYIPAPIKDRYSALRQKATSSYETVQPYITTTRTVLRELTSTQYARNFYEGLVLPLWHTPEALSAIKKSPKIRSVLFQTTKSSTRIFLVSVAYYNYVRPQLLSYSSEDSYTVSAMDLAVSGYLTAQLPRFFIDETINTASFSDALTEVTPENCDHFDCDCEPTEKRQGNLNTIFYYPTDAFLVFLISLTPLVGKYLGLILTPVFVGYTLLDYRLNMCDKDRSATAAKNNFFLLGLGTNMQVLCWLLGKVTADSQFTKLALQALVMKLGMLTTALRDQPLPGKEATLHFFKYQHLATSEMVKDGISKLYQRIKEQRKKDSTGSQKTLSAATSEKNIYDALKASLATVISTTVGEDFSHLDSLVRTDTMSLLIRLKKDKIRAVLDTIQSAHDHPYVVTATKKIIEILPGFLLPAGINEKEIEVFTNIIYLNAVKQALPVIAKLVDHALQDADTVKEAELRKNEQIRQEVVASLEELLANVEQNILVSSWSLTPSADNASTPKQVQEEDGDDYADLAPTIQEMDRPPVIDEPVFDSDYFDRKTAKGPFKRQLTKS